MYTLKIMDNMYIYICAMVKLRRLYGFKFMVIHHMSRVSSSIMFFQTPFWMDFSDHPKGAKQNPHGKPWQTDVNMIKRTVCKYEQ